MPMDDCYNIDGEPITYGEWARLFEIPEYKVVARTETETYVVSTVWLGLNHQYGVGPPIIFETMVFARAQWEDTERRGLRDFDCDRYSTLQQAQEGHEAMVTLVRATEQTVLTQEEQEEDARPAEDRLE